jgi:hypothetical protein
MNGELLKTKYGAEIPKELMVEYFNRLTGKIFKCLPMIEQSDCTLSIYIEYLLIELAGGNEILYKDTLFLDLLANLEAVNGLLEDYPNYRNQILKCTGICNLIIKKLREGDDLCDHTKQKLIQLSNNDA